MFMNTKPYRPSENGNALFIVLIGVALFVALTQAVMNTGRMNETSLSQEKAGIVASQVMRYGENIRKAIERVQLLNGCEWHEISTHHPDSDSYFQNNNSTSPVDESCHIYSKNGGQAYFIKRNPATDPSDTSRNIEYTFSSRGQYNGVGIDNLTDLSIILNNIPKEICLAFNRLALKIDTIPTDNFYASWTSRWNGTVYLDNSNDSAAKLGDSGSPELHGKYEGCMQHTVNSKYKIYMIMIAR
jgi:type II secretory pathway pseudopilin PulG